MGHVEQRSAFRFATEIEADCRMTSHAWSARLHNISTTGCMMACPAEGLPQGWMLRLRIKGLPAIDAEIVWRHRGHAGLRFLVALPSTALEHLGYRLPESSPPCLAASRPPAGLHSQLVKRNLEAADRSGAAA
jgi:hypothetical protein